MTRYFDPHRKTMQEDPKETGTPVSPVPLPLVDAPAVEPDGTHAELENPRTPPEEVVDSSNWVPVAEFANPQRESRSPSEMWPYAPGSSVSVEVRTSRSWLFRLIEGMGRWTEFFFWCSQPDWLSGLRHRSSWPADFDARLSDRMQWPGREKSEDSFGASRIEAGSPTRQYCSRHADDPLATVLCFLPS